MTTHVVRFDLPLDAKTFDGALRSDPGIELTVCSATGDADGAWSALQRAHVYHVSSARDELPSPWFVRADLLARAPALLAVSTYGAGADTVDIAACTRAGVCVMNQAGSNAVAVAEHTLGLLLGLSRRISESDRRLRRGDRFPRHEAIGLDLAGRTLGLVGIGHVGRRVASLATALGMQVIAFDPLLPADEIRRRGAEPVDWAGLLGRADAVSLHCPLDTSTRGLFDAAAFAAMKAGAFFVSTARGDIHDEDALYAALRAGHLRGAGLDVWQREPPQADHPLLGMDQVIATYHCAGVTQDARTRMARMAADQILALLHGERPPRLLNPEVWPETRRRLTGLIH